MYLSTWDVYSGVMDAVWLLFHSCFLRFWLCSWLVKLGTNGISSMSLTSLFLLLSLGGCFEVLRGYWGLQISNKRSQNNNTKVNLARIAQLEARIGLGTAIWCNCGFESEGILIFISIEYFCISAMGSIQSIFTKYLTYRTGGFNLANINWKDII